MSTRARVDQTDRDLAKRVQDLVLLAGGEGMHTLRRYHEIWQRIAAGDLGEDSIREEWIRFARDESERYTKVVTSIGRAFFEGLTDLSRRYSPPFFERAFVPSAQTGVVTPASSRSGAVLEVPLRGVMGGEAHGSFVVEDRRGEGDEVSFVVSEFRGPAGPTLPPPLRLRPARFVLAPYGRREVSVTLPLLVTWFEPGHRYEGTISVSSHDPFDLRVVAVALPADPAG